jgi:Mg-chelatase subunit ChlD
VRVLWLVLAVLALAQPVWRRPPTDRVGVPVVVLQDVSDSVRGDATAESKRTRLLQVLPSGTTAVERFFAADVAPSAPAVKQTDQTDLEAALNTANEHTIGSAGPHIILLTDGRATTGDATQASRRIAMRGGHVHVLPIGVAAQTGLRVTGVEPPIQARQGVMASAKVTLSAPHARRVHLRLVEGTGQVAAQKVLTVEGESTLLMNFTPARSGVLAYRLELGEVAGASTRPVQSHELWVCVEGPPRILVVDPFPEEAVPLRKALEPLTMPVDVVTPRNLPADLGPYAAVALGDLSGKELTPEQRAQIRLFVEEQGSGLVWIAGGNTVASYWRDNPLSAVLPVELEDRRSPSPRIKNTASVCFVFDRSGSMGGALPHAGGNAVRKLDLVKTSILASLQVLPEEAMIAAVTFDTRPDVVVPPTRIALRPEIARTINSVSVGGGTVMEPAVRKGLDLLRTMPGDKYIVVLTDGRVEARRGDARWIGLLDDVKQANVSWTSIAVGQDADRELLRDMADHVPGGRYFYCGTGDDIPRVFIDHAKSIRKSTDVRQDPFRVRPGPDAGLIKHIPIEETPLLHGRSHAKAKLDTQVILMAEESDPLLVRWQFGAGRVVAFTSDAKADWAREWLAWRKFSDFWVQVVQGVLRPPRNVDVRVQCYRSGNRVRFSYDVIDKNGKALHGLNGRGTVALGPRGPDPDAVGNDIAWQEERSGQYVATITLPRDGNPRIVGMSLHGENRQAIRYVTMVPGTASAECEATGPDYAALSELASAGSGAFSDDPLAVARACEPGPPHSIPRDTPLWPWLVIAAIVLWPLDLLVRKVL